MEEIEQTLTLDEFVDASCRWYDSLTLPEKNVILNYKKKQKKAIISDYKFQVLP